MEEKILGEGGENTMDELYTVEEMMKLLKMSRQTLYTIMNEGRIPFVKIRGHRRFIARQVMKAIKDMQTAQIHAELYGDKSEKVEEKEASQLVPIDTLSDVCRSSSTVNPSKRSRLQQLRKRSDKVKKSQKEL